MPNSSKIYICHTPYHLLISCVKELKQEESPSASIVLMDCISGVEEYRTRLEQSGFFEKVRCVKHEDYFSSWTNTSFYKSLLWLKMSPSARRKFAFILESSEVYIFNDHRDMGAVLHHFKKQYHLLEDGCDCFKHFDQSNLPTANKPFLRKVLKHVLNIPISMGDSRYCIDIELNSADGLATDISKPIIVSEKKELFAGLNEKAIKALRIIFPIGELDAEGSAALVLTSPPEAHGKNWTEDDQRAFYARIVSQCQQDTVFLKPHPRDFTNYNKISDKVIVVPREFPIEVLDIISRKGFDVGICYMSTALSQLECCKRKVYLESGMEESSSVI